VPLDLTHFSPLGPLGRLERLARGFSLEVGEARFMAQVVRADVLRLALEREGARKEPPTPSVVCEPDAAARCELTVRPADIVLRTDELELRVERDELHFAVTRRDGTTVVESARDALGRSLAYQELNDAFALVRRARPQDLVLGLGEKTGPFDRRGKSYTLFNVDVLAPDVHRHNRLLGSEEPPDPENTDFDPFYSSIPFFLHGVREQGRLRFAGSFIDNGWIGKADFESTTELKLEFSGGAYVEYIMAGPSVRGVVEAYTFLTGRPSLPPLWSLGHQ
jgi:alpha-glucosidase